MSDQLQGSGYEFGKTHLSCVGYMDSLLEFLYEDSLHDGPAQTDPEDLAGRAKEICD